MDVKKEKDTARDWGRDSGRARELRELSEIEIMQDLYKERKSLES